MKGYVIDCRGFSEDKKKLVMDAFYKMGIKWEEGHKYSLLKYDKFGNIFRDGSLWGKLIYGIDPISSKQAPYEISFNDLMKEAAMEGHMEKEELNEDTLVSVEFTVAQLLTLAALVGESCNYSTTNHYEPISEKIDELGLYRHVVGIMNLDVEGGWVGSDASRYIKDIFKPKDTPNQKRAREMREEAEKLLAKAKELEENL